jgi:glutamyl-tRNA synthetase
MFIFLLIMSIGRLIFEFAYYNPLIFIPICFALASIIYAIFSKNLKLQIIGRIGITFVGGLLIGHVGFNLYNHYIHSRIIDSGASFTIQILTFLFATCIFIGINSFLSYRTFNKCPIKWPMIKIRVRVRFAPSPTGEMHVGNLRTAIFNYIYAKQSNGEFYLRIEDTDVARSKLIYEESIKETLKWLNIKYEPLVLRQSERFPIYTKIAQKLYKKNYAYYCSCDNLEENEKSCDCETKSLTSGVLRFRVPRHRIMDFNDEILGKVTVNSNTIENFALLRSDGSPTYNFVVVVDDGELKITHVFRGNEHLYNTFKQLLIYKALNLTPPKFGHFPMINGKDGKKLSKRSGDTSVRYYREIGVVAEALFNFLIRLGWGHGNQEIFTMDEAIKLFSVNKISRSPAMFDNDKLMYLCGYYLHLNWEKHFPDLILVMEKKISRPITGKEKDKIKKLAGEFSNRSKLLGELADSLIFLVIPVKLTNNIDMKLLKEVINTLENIKEWKEKIINDKVKEIFSFRMKEVCGVLRLALMNVTFSPSVFLVLEVLEKEEAIRRLQMHLINP